MKMICMRRWTGCSSASRSIERKLAARHLGEGSLALYDLSSSYFEGTHCPLGKIGYSRDGKKNKLQVNYGLMTTRQGCPISVSVYEGNTSDTKTLMPQVTKLKESFGLERVVLVGDRGMISHKAIGELKDIDGLAWITALKSGQIRGLVEAGALQLGLFDERNLFEFSDPKYPDERLIACRNPQLAKLRAHKRQALLEATRLELDKIRDRVARGALDGCRRDRREARASARQIQSRQALRADHHGHRREVSDPRTPSRRRSGARWHLRHPHRHYRRSRCPRPRPCAVTRRSPKSNGRSAP